ncbi:MAG: hypothetical protein AAFS07_11910 [Pseudomonadota bacterium]
MSIEQAATLETDAEAEAWLARNLAHAKEVGPVGVEARLTPALARCLLDRNDQNRPLSRTNLTRLCNDIRAGRWVLNGQTIIVAEDGQLNDGQHRCHAVLATGIAVPTLFSFGVSRDSRLTVDMGAQRDVGSFLAMQGIPNASAVATVCNYLIQVAQRGEIGGGTFAPTKQEQLAFWRANRDVEDSVSFVPTTTAKIGGRPILAAAHFLIRRKHGDQADDFIRALIKGERLDSTDPVLRAREWLTDATMRARSQRGYKLTAQARLEVVLRAWNARVRGTTPQRIQATGRLPQVV